MGVCIPIEVKNCFKVAFHNECEICNEGYHLNTKKNCIKNP